MYVVPFSMGPLGSDKSQIGVQLTDSAYVVVHHADHDPHGHAARSSVLGDDGEFVPCVHSVGAPLEPTASRTCRGRRNAENKYIVHYPESREIWSYGSGYGGNALLGKKCFALRIASVMARDEGWMAEHMLILKLTSPEGEVKYVTGAFPSACGKTNLAMLIPTIEGWKVETIGDDIAWMKFGEDGRLYADQPRGRLLRRRARAPASRRTPTRSAAIAKNTIFTNCALTDDGDVWWEGMTEEPPAHAIDWHGNDWTPGRPTTRPRTRTRASRSPAAQVPVDRARVGGPRRRADRRVPLRRPPRDRRAARARGVRLGARRVPRRDDGLGEDGGRRRHGRRAALRPVRDAAVLRLQHGRLLRALAEDRRRRDGAKLPRIFYVNWFRKDADGKFLWPGFGENSRVLEWIFRRCDGEADAVETPIGLVPAPGALDTEGLDLAARGARGAADRRRRRSCAAELAAGPRAPRASSATACPARCARSSTRSSSA